MLINQTKDKRTLWKNLQRKLELLISLQFADMGEAFKGWEGVADPLNFSLSSGEYVVFI
ncbi:hypothetical protein Hanom_Chr14g01295861 [Helianthus anomalus]